MYRITCRLPVCGTTRESSYEVPFQEMLTCHFVLITGSVSQQCQCILNTFSWLLETDNILISFA